MNVRVLAILFCSLLALVGASVYVPVRWGFGSMASVPSPHRLPPHSSAGVVQPWELKGSDQPDWVREAYELRARVVRDHGTWVYANWWYGPDFRCVWDPELRRGSWGGTPFELQEYRVNWPFLFAEQALILLLAGALLTWALRRDRRARLAAGERS